MTTGVKVDAKRALEHLSNAGDVISGKNRSIVLFANKEHKKETANAFRLTSAPESGRKWPQRKHPYPWPLLNHYGNLQSMINHGYGIKTKDKRLKLFGKIRDGFFSGGYSRGGGGALLRAHKPNIVVAGSIFFGRKRGRSAAGWRTRTRKGVTRTRLHGGGSRLRTAASTGTTPPRPFFGFGQVSKFRIKRFVKRKIKEQFD